MPGDLRHAPFSAADNCVLSDTDIATDELLRFKAAGGGTTVDLTMVGIGRDLNGSVERTAR